MLDILPDSAVVELPGILIYEYLLDNYCYHYYV